MDEYEQHTLPLQEPLPKPEPVVVPQPEIPPNSACPPSFYSPYGYGAQSAACSPYLNSNVLPWTAPLPYDNVHKAAVRSNRGAKAAFALGVTALLFLAFWVIYPPSGLIMTLLGLAISLMGLRLARQARRLAPSNLAEAGYMLNFVGLAASCAFCLLGVAACVGLAALINGLL